MKIEKKIKNLIASIIIILSSLILAYLVNAIPFIQSMEEALINLRFQEKNHLEKPTVIKSGVYKEGEKVESDILILGIDEISVNADYLGPFPWKRSVYADFLKYFGAENSEYNPHFIFFDIFIDSYRDKKTDEIFFEELKKHDNVFFDYYTQYPEEQRDEQTKRLLKRFKYVKKFQLHPKNPEDFSGNPVFDLKPNVEEVGKAALGTGSALVEAERDGVVRRMPLVVMFYDERIMKKNQPTFLPTIDMIIFMKYYQVKMENIEIVFGKHAKFKDAIIPIKKKNKDGSYSITGHTKRDIIIPIDKQGKYYINFQGESGSFANISFAYVNLDKQRDNKVVYKGKNLLVGFYSTAGLGSTKDYFTTPYGTMYGIEIHANAIHTVLKGNFIRIMPWTAQHLITIGITILLALVLVRINIIKGLILGIVCVFVVFSFGIFIFSGTLFGAQLSSPPLYLFNMTLPFTSVIIALIINISYKVLTEEKEKKFIKGVFGNYVNPEVVNEIIKDPSKLQLGGETRDLSVFFSDIRGFTSISEKLSAEDLVLYLNKYLTAMTDILLKNKGTLDKYIGDAVMAFWGAPIYYEEHAYLACKTALEMMQALRELNDSTEFPDDIYMDIGIGINSGPCVAGNMGSALRKNYTVMGDSVNLASRLEGTNKFYFTHIIVSEYTYELVKDQFLFRELDLIRVKGKNKPVRIYELLAFKDEVETLNGSLIELNPENEKE